MDGQARRVFEAVAKPWSYLQWEEGGQLKLADPSDDGQKEGDYTGNQRMITSDKPPLAHESLVGLSQGWAGLQGV